MSNRKRKREDDEINHLENEKERLISIYPYISEKLLVMVNKYTTVYKSKN